MGAINTIGELKAFIVMVKTKTGRHEEDYRDLMKDFYKRVAVICRTLCKEQGIFGEAVWGEEDALLGEESQKLADELETWYQEKIMNHV